LGKADLLFCAILLRLADILDFDNSRTPDEVYTYLELARSRRKPDGTTQDARKSRTKPSGRSTW
jgi:hypothetical protein